MRDNEIIKALDILKEWQTLAYHNDDGTDEDSHELYWALAIVFKHISRQNAEIDSLQRRIVFWKEDLNYNPKKERTEAIREFAERLKEKAFPDDSISCEMVVYLIKHGVTIPTRCKDCIYNKIDGCDFGEAYDPNYDGEFYCANGERE